MEGSCITCSKKFIDDVLGSCCQTPYPKPQPCQEILQSTLSGKELFIAPQRQCEIKYQQKVILGIPGVLKLLAKNQQRTSAAAQLGGAHGAESWR
ncbi:hypothetical protein RRG08_056306 [Elysia crispata]|uniref:Uncharacterized protein n=1 Tax=Elysia crispata TaxID=231223 RepID=A0AAE1B2K5_9GAST|nr:hypothetical protein RRG08_056306 [Elysia crispata]